MVIISCTHESHVIIHMNNKTGYWSIWESSHFHFIMFSVPSLAWSLGKWAPYFLRFSFITTQYCCVATMLYTSKDAGKPVLIYITFWSIFSLLPREAQAILGWNLATLDWEVKITLFYGKWKRNWSKEAKAHHLVPDYLLAPFPWNAPITGGQGRVAQYLNGLWL